MEHISAIVLANKQVASGYFCLTLALPPGHEVPQPGQFLTARVGDGIAPLLRRPFAYAAYRPAQEGQSPGTSPGGLAQCDIVYERRGNATQALTGYQPGDKLDIMGPLGNSFPLPPQGTTPVLVGGGIGMGPILFFDKYLREHGYSPVLAIGSRSGDRIPELPEGSLIASDDGAKGFKGTIVAALKQTIHKGTPYTFYACGPHRMMEAIRDWTTTWAAWANPGSHLPQLWVSLEQTMACAVGACMGCVVRVTGPKPWARVCTEGPIFDANTIQWEAHQ